MRKLPLRVLLLTGKAILCPPVGVRKRLTRQPPLMGCDESFDEYTLISLTSVLMLCFYETK
jgi:hypothetical protein